MSDHVEPLTQVWNLVPARVEGAPAAAIRSDEPLRFALFGGVRIRRGDAEIEVTQPKQRTLLALLLANAGDLVPVSSIIDALWAEEPAPTAVNQVHRHIGALRRTCEPQLERRQPGHYITGGSRGYRIVLGPTEFDVTHFRDLASEARRLGGAENRADALRHYLQALALATASAGDDEMQLLPGFAAIEDERVRAMIAATEQCILPADFAAVLPLLRAACTLHPFNESLQASLMKALTHTGRSAEALLVFRSVRRTLRDELGSEPGSELGRAQANALRDPSPKTNGGARRSAAAKRPRPAQLPMPVPGFVGRRTLLATLAEPAHRRRVLLVAGRAGVGKTSLAVRHATNIAHRYPDGQLYVNLRGFEPAADSMSPDEALYDMLNSLNVGADELPGRTSARAGLLRSILSTKRVLMVLDDAHDYRQLEPLLPGPGRTDVIITSRSRLPALLAFNHAEFVELEPFADDELVEFLQRRLPPGKAMSGPHRLLELGRTCGRLPLNLAILAARAAADPDVPLELLARKIAPEAARPDWMRVGRTEPEPSGVFAVMEGGSRDAPFRAGAAAPARNAP